MNTFSMSFLKMTYMYWFYIFCTKISLSLILFFYVFCEIFTWVDNSIYYEMKFLPPISFIDETEQWAHTEVWFTQMYTYPI